MKMTAAVLVLAIAGVANAEVTVTTIVTMQDVQADYDAKQWAECLAKIAKLLPFASPQDKIPLLSMKAESLLGQKSTAQAADAFATLATAYMGKATKDVKAAATAKATSEMIRVSQKTDEDMVYVPKVGKNRAALSIIDPATRPAALSAYFTDQQVATQDGIKAMGKNMSSETVLSFAPKLVELGKVELAVTGDDKQTVMMQKDLALQVKTGMATYVSNSSKSVDNIVKSATTMVAAPRQQPNTGAVTKTGRGNAGNTQQPQQQVMKGLSDQDKSNLQAIAASLQKISTNARPLASTLGMEADYYKAEVASAATLNARVSAVLSGKFQ